VTDRSATHVEVQPQRSELYAVGNVYMALYGARIGQTRNVGSQIFSGNLLEHTETNLMVYST
jgi:hypothetical protein